MTETLRRIVTGHDHQGNPRFEIDEFLPFVGPPDGNLAAALIWTTAEVPADNNDPTDGSKRDVGITLRGGSAIRMVAVGPGFTSPPHRTLSIDYGIVLSGALELQLEGGETRRIETGDVVVQRGTLHTWRNPSDSEWCRVLFILIEAAPLTIAGRSLEMIDM